MIRIRTLLLLSLPVAVGCGGNTTTAPSSSTATSSTFTLSGHVTSSTTGKAISGALVTLLPSAGPAGSQAATTDSTGAYTLSNLSSGSYNLTVTAAAWTPLGNNVNVSSNRTVDFALSCCLTTLQANWSGTSQQGYPVSFVVDGSNAITAVVLTFLPSPGAGCLPLQFHQVTLGSSVNISESGFTYSGPLNLRADSPTSITGTFSSATDASGNATVQWAGGTGGICAGTVSFTWTATKQ